MFGSGGNSLRILLEFVATTRVASCDVPDDDEDVAASAASADVADSVASADVEDVEEDDDGDAKASTKRSCNTFFNPSVGKLRCLSWSRTWVAVNLSESIVEQKGVHTVVAQ